MNIGSRAPLALLISVLVAFSACGRDGRRAELPATWVWDQDQTLVSPDRGSRNTWSGWTVRGGSFEAEKAGKFILWMRTAGMKRLHVDYSLEGRPAEIVVNSRARKRLLLEPSLRLRTAEIEAPFRAGLNILEFRGFGKGPLRVRRIAVGRPDPPAADDLGPGESVTMFLRPGRGRIEWRGSGEISAKIRVSVSGQFREDMSSLETRFLSRSLRHEFELAGPGTLTVKAVKGRFNIVRFDYEENKPAAPPEPKRLLDNDPPVFILLADACQAKHLGVYGYPRRTSPNIDAFAGDAVVFENAYANASYTRSSVRSLFSGLPPERSAVGNLTRISDLLPVIPEYMKIKGYRTSIFTSTVTISPTFGFTKGVDDYHQYLAGEEDTFRTRRIDLDAFGRWLERPGPLFSYVHFIEPHFPILPPPPFLDMFSGAAERKAVPGKGRLMDLMEHPTALKRPFTPAEVQEVVDDYDSTIAYVDSEIGRALGHIRKAGLYDDALIVILSDHGEALYEHKAWGHSRNVFEETTRVPLLVKFPASMNLRGRVRRIVQLTDIFPTLTDLFGQSVALPGRSLFEAIAEPEIDDSCAVSQSIAEVGQFGMRWRQWYYIISLNTGRERLFDLDRDPLAEAEEGAKETKDFFRAMFLDWLVRAADAPEASTAIDLKTLTPAEIEALKTLGYIR